METKDEGFDREPGISNGCILPLGTVAIFVGSVFLADWRIWLSGIVACVSAVLWKLFFRRSCCPKCCSRNFVRNETGSVSEDRDVHGYFTQRAETVTTCLKCGYQHIAIVTVPFPQEYEYGVNDL